MSDYYAKAMVLRADDLAENHLLCCGDRFGLCGIELEPETVGSASDNGPVDCRTCVLIDEAHVPCIARFCRLRSWFRDRWHW